MKNPSALMVPAQSFTSLLEDFFVPPLHHFLYVLLVTKGLVLHFPQPTALLKLL